MCVCSVYGTVCTVSVVQTPWPWRPLTLPSSLGHSNPGACRAGYGGRARSVRRFLHCSIGYFTIPSVTSLFHPLLHCSIRYFIVPSLASLFRRLLHCSIGYFTFPSLTSLFHRLLHCPIGYFIVSSLTSLFRRLLQCSIGYFIVSSLTSVFRRLLHCSVAYFTVPSVTSVFHRLLHRVLFTCRRSCWCCLCCLLKVSALTVTGGLGQAMAYFTVCCSRALVRVCVVC